MNNLHGLLRVLIGLNNLGNLRYERNSGTMWPDSWGWRLLQSESVRGHQLASLPAAGAGMPGRLHGVVVAKKLQQGSGTEHRELVDSGSSYPTQGARKHFLLPRSPEGNNANPASI